jgi:hypothetical protein
MEMPSNAAFHPTIETVGLQTAFSVNPKGLFISNNLFQGSLYPFQVSLKKSFFRVPVDQTEPRDDIRKLSYGFGQAWKSIFWMSTP